MPSQARGGRLSIAPPVTASRPWATLVAVRAIGMCAHHHGVGRWEWAREAERTQRSPCASAQPGKRAARRDGPLRRGRIAHVG
jgi:hypothetical protein